MSMQCQTVRVTAPDEFLEWLQTQDQRCELVNGVPVAMAGANRRHDRIVVNAIGQLHARLRGSRRTAFSADTAVRIPSGNIRFPDAGIDCGALVDAGLAAAEPVLALEVLSASTRDFDLFSKLEEYKTVPTLRHIVMVNPDEPQIAHWTRDAAGWSLQSLEGMDAALALVDLQLSVPLAELYEGLAFRPRPKLVPEPGQA